MSYLYMPPIGKVARYSSNGLITDTNVGSAKAYIHRSCGWKKTEDLEEKHRALDIVCRTTSSHQDIVSDGYWFNLATDRCEKVGYNHKKCPPMETLEVCRKKCEYVVRETIEAIKAAEEAAQLEALELELPAVEVDEPLYESILDPQ